MTFLRLSLCLALPLCIFLGSSPARAITSCSASCLVGSCSISCPGSGGGGVCGCYAGLIAVCSCGGGGSISATAAIAASELQSSNGYDVLQYFESFGTEEGDRLAALTTQVILSLDGGDSEAYSRYAEGLRSSLRNASAPVLSGLLEFSSALPTPASCEGPTQVDVSVGVDGTTKHEVSGCAATDSQHFAWIFATLGLLFAVRRTRKARSLA